MIDTPPLGDYHIESRQALAKAERRYTELTTKRFVWGRARKVEQARYDRTMLRLWVLHLDHVAIRQEFERKRGLR